MSRQTAQPAIKTIEEKSVATKENFIMTEIVKKSKKSCYGIVDKLKRKMLVTTKKIMSRQFLEAKVYKELGATNFVSRHKTFLSRQEQDYWIKTLSRQYQSLS